MKVKGWVFFVAALLAAPVFVSAQSGHDHGAHNHAKEGTDGVTQKQGKNIALTGEVIDISCYMGHLGKGEKHRKCAKSCVLDKGLPMGILTGSGKVYLVVEDHANAKAYQQIKELAADHVEVKGKKFERGGMQAISLHSVKKIK